MRIFVYLERILETVPNLALNQFYKFIPYINKKGKRGLIIKDLSEESVPSHYRRFEKDGDTWIVTTMNEFPSPDFDTSKASKDRWRLYFMGVDVFLKERAQAVIEKWGGVMEKREDFDGIPGPSDNDFIPTEEKDIPF